MRSRTACVFVALLTVSVLPKIAPAQDHLLVEVERPFPIVDGVELETPFLGGFDLPRPQFVDIDGDSDLDLFVQELTGSVMYFENTGSPTSPTWRFENPSYQGLDIGQWFFFADLDSDGDYDLLAEQTFGLIRAYRNDGTRRDAVFAAWADTLRDSGGSALLTEPPSVPFLLDVDCNGKIDLMIGRGAGTISRYEMTSGPGEVPVFDLVDDMYQGILVMGGTGKQTAARGVAHGASAMSFADVDGDSDPDLLWGDFFEPNIIFFRNDGSCSNASMTRVTDSYMMSNDGVFDTSGLNVPRPVDIDGDGDQDLVVGVMGGAFVPTSTSIDNFYYLEAVAGEFSLVTRRFIPTLDVGTEAAPLLFDIDDDSDLDLLIGNLIDPSEPVRGSVTLFRNTGSSTDPRYVLVDSDFLRFDESFSPAPAAADIDSDGDTDLFFGTFGGEIVFYGNVGSSGAPDWRLDTEAFLGFDIGADSYPTFGDLDGDGDLDLLVGESSGQLNLFVNEGSASTPDFVLATESFAGIDVGQRSRPRLVDYDADGDLDLFVGSSGGVVAYFRNEGSSLIAAFVQGDSAVTGMIGTVSPATGDVDGDSDVDLLIGTVSGGGRYFRNEVVPTSAVRNPPEGRPEYHIRDVYPNPAKDRVTISIEGSSDSGPFRLELVDVLGRIVQTMSIGSGFATRREVTLDTDLLSSGLVLVRLVGPDGMIDAARLVVL